MSSRERLDSYLSELRTRIRALVFTRAAAVALAAVLLITCVAVVVLARTGFPASLTIGVRVLLVLALIATAVLLLWLPLRKLAIANGAAEFERRLPSQHGRIQTYLDMQRREALGERSVFADLLAEDAATLTDANPVQSVVAGKHLWGAGAVAAFALAVLIALLTMGPAQWGYGTRHLLLGASIPKEVVPERLIHVKPGNATVRRNSDLSISANMQGFTPEQAAVFVRFDDEKTWQRAPMQAQTDQNGADTWAFKLYALRGSLHYYVESDNSRSAEHTIAVAELPKIDKVRLTYSYPQWTGLAPSTDENQRDIRAVAATQVKVEVFADAALVAPALIVNGEAAAIDAAGNNATGTVTVGKPGSYFIGAKVANEFVPLTEDYAIEVIEDEKPSIEILKPGRDWRATNIEEVPVRIQAQDDFKLQDVELRYAVNGGKWQAMNLAAGGRETNSDSMLRLEELGAAQPALDARLPAQLSPGDLVSYYAVAKDRSKQVQTDLFMVQVQPFERRFTQNQAGGGGGAGAGGDEQGAISERQKEILLATWNLQRSDANADKSGKRTRQQLTENAVMLAELQTTLAQQARTVAERTRARVSIDQDPRVKSFVESMESAATLMDPAAKHLKDFKLGDAVPAEQQALQQLLRAESAFRDVQVSMQQEGGGSGGGAEAARNFSEMFELEMDMKKNQYETQSQLSQESQQQEVDDAIRKLKELAERQEKLAQQANRNQIPQQEQRWRQEQLRREAEDLKRRLAELSKEQQGSPSGAQQSSSRQANNQSGGQSGEASGQSSDEQSDSRSGSEQKERSQQREQLANTLKSLTKALEEMRSANGTKAGEQQRQANGQQGQQGKPGESQGAGANGNEQGAQGEQSGTRTASAQSAEEAGRNLRKALKQMETKPQRGLGETINQLADQAKQLSEQQHGVESGLQEALNEAAQANRRRGSLDPKRARTLAEEKQKMTRDLTRLQAEMRDAAHENRSQAPDATKRLIESLSELEESNVMFRIGRSADEVLYGRAREAAAREGLIGEALENLEKGLRDSAVLAERRREQPGDDASPEQMLARIAELRRALQQAQSGEGGKNQGSQAQGSSTQGNNAQGNNAQGNNAQGNNAQSGDTPGGESQQRSASSGEQPSSQQSSSGQSPGNESSASSAGGNPNGPSGPGGLTAWNPGSRNGLQSRETGAGQYREAAELSEQMRNLANRMRGGELNRAEIEAMRRMTQDLRRLAGNPIADAEAASISQLIDRIELTALAAVEKSKDRAASRTTVQNTDTPEYRDAVAEYYRRLGGTRAGGATR